MLSSFNFIQTARAKVLHKRNIFLLSLRHCWGEPLEMSQGKCSSVLVVLQPGEVEWNNNSIPKILTDLYQNSEALVTLFCFSVPRMRCLMFALVHSYPICNIAGMERAKEAVFSSICFINCREISFDDAFISMVTTCITISLTVIIQYSITICGACFSSLTLLSLFFKSLIPTCKDINQSFLS